MIYHLAYSHPPSNKSEDKAQALFMPLASESVCDKDKIFLNAHVFLSNGN